jgi:hypothetical protein
MKLRFTRRAAKGAKGVRLLSAQAVAPARKYGDCPRDVRPKGLAPELDKIAIYWL